MAYAPAGPVVAERFNRGTVRVAVADMPKILLTLMQAAHIADGLHAVLAGAIESVTPVRGAGMFGAERLPDERITVHYGDLSKALVVTQAQAQQFADAVKVVLEATP